MLDEIGLVSGEYLSNQEKMVITIYKDGSWKLWGTVDAIYARGEDDWLCEIGILEVVEQANKERLNIASRNAG